MFLLALPGERSSREESRQVTEKSRRTPRQARAEVTVEAIFDATFQLLEAGGLESLTTNHIAQRAGVSIGTLYQYFGGKQEILAAIAGKARLNLDLSPESLFVLTHAVASLLRAVAAEPDLNLSPAVLEDEFVLLMESYLSALIARERGGA